MVSLAAVAVLGGAVVVLLRVARWVWVQCVPRTARGNMAAYGCDPDCARASWALVTGASSGIGFAFVEELAAAGFNVLGVDLPHTKLKATLRGVAARHHVRTHGLECDVSQHQDSVLQALEATVRAVCKPDLRVVINNVGVTTRVPTPLADHTDGDIHRILSINCAFTTLATRTLLPLLKANGSEGAQGRSAIIIVSSLAGTIPNPLGSVYAASKAYLISLTRSLGLELAGSCVDVGCALPGAVPACGETSRWLRGSAEHVTGATPAQIAQGALSKFNQGYRVFCPHRAHSFEAAAMGVLPNWLIGTLVRRMYTKARGLALEGVDKSD